MRVAELFNLEGRVAIVTGGSRGLGLEIAEGLGEAGARVAVTGRRESWLRSAEDHLASHGVEACALQADVSSPDDCARVVATVLEQFGGVDVLVNNAGVSWGAPAEAMPLEKWNAVLATNLTGAFLMARAVAGPMRTRGHGSIINIVSVAGLVGTPAGVMDAVGYSASKGGLVSLTRDLAVKWAGDGIRVNAVAPGFFPTRMSEPLLAANGERIIASIPMGRVGTEGELKGAVLYLASRASSYVTGQVLVVDGGLSAC